MDASQAENTTEHMETNSSEMAEVATPETKAIPEKKARSSGRKRRSDADMMAEAKATCGHEIDPSEGRQLRKRPDPPKVEKKTPARKPSARKSKTPNKEEEKETMVENDVKDHVDGVKADDSHAETAVEERPTNGEDAHEVTEDVTDNGEKLAAEAPEAETAEAPPADAEKPEVEKPAEEAVEQKTAEEPERTATTESMDNATNNSV